MEPGFKSRSVFPRAQSLLVSVSVQLSVSDTLQPMDCSTPVLHCLFHCLSFLVSQSLLMPIESVMPSNHLILCHPLFLLPSIFPSIWSFQRWLIGLFQWVSSSHQVVKVFEFQLQHQFWSAAATAAKSLQSCPTLCDPIDIGSPLGSSIPGILQARILEWVAISLSNAWKWKVKVKSLSRARLCVTPWTAAYQAPPSMGFSRQEYWNGLPLPPPSVPV